MSISPVFDGVGQRRQLRRRPGRRHRAGQAEDERGRRLGRPRGASGWPAGRGPARRCRRRWTRAGPRGRWPASSCPPSPTGARRPGRGGATSSRRVAVAPRGRQDREVGTLGRWITDHRGRRRPVDRARGRRAALLPELADAPLRDCAASRTAWRCYAASACSAMVVPLRARGQVLGALTLGRAAGRAALLPGATSTSRATSPPRRARRRQRPALRPGARRAVALQRSLLPAVPAVPGLDVASRYLAATERRPGRRRLVRRVPLPDGAVGVAVGDVDGPRPARPRRRWASCAACSAPTRGRASAPDAVLDGCDDLVQGLGMAPAGDRVYGRLLPARRGALLRYANAGHPPPVVPAATARSSCSTAASRC